MTIVQNGSDYQYKESLQLLSFRLRLTVDHILDWPTTLCHPIQPCKPSDVSHSSHLSPLEPIVFTNIIMRIATLTLIQFLSDHDVHWYRLTLSLVMIIMITIIMIMVIILLSAPVCPRQVDRCLTVCGQLPPQEASRASPPSAHRLRHCHCHHQDHGHHHHSSSPLSPTSSRRVTAKLKQWGSNVCRGHVADKLITLDKNKNNSSRETLKAHKDMHAF